MAIISPIMLVAPPFEKNINDTYPSTIRVQYLRILFSSFGEKDISVICIKFAMFKFVFGYYFANNVGGATI